MKLSPNSYIRLKNITWYKNVKQVFQTLCLDLIPLSVVEEHCISEEAKAKATVERIQERMLA